MARASARTSAAAIGAAAKDVLLGGDYARLLPVFRAMNVRRFVLEYAMPRAGNIAVVGAALTDREIGLSVVNPRTAAVESPAEIVARAETIPRWYRPEQVTLNPDCGFGRFANRGVNDQDTVAAKLGAMMAAAREPRQRHGSGDELAAG